MEAGGCSPNPTRGKPVFSPSTPQPARPFFCPAAAEELGQLVLEEHGGGSLHLMHLRSLIGCVDSNQLTCPSYVGVRRRAVVWFAKTFSTFNLRDEWMVGALTLLDRLEASRAQSARTPQNGVRGRAQRDAENSAQEKAEWLAVALCVLKLSSAEAELETVSLKELIFQLDGSPRRSHYIGLLWNLVIKAEMGVLKSLDYNIAVPCSADLAARIAVDIVAAARRDCSPWPGLQIEYPPAPRPELTAPVPRFSLLVAFLVELGLAHIQDAVYGQKNPPVALALAAVHLALYAFGVAPPVALKAFKNAEQETLMDQTICLLPPLEQNLHKTWASPPFGSKVVSKWEDRAVAHFSHGPLPAAGELPPCQADPPLKTPERTPRRRSPPPTTGPHSERLSAEKLPGPGAIDSTKIASEPAAIVMARANVADPAEKPSSSQALEGDVQPAADVDMAYSGASAACASESSCSRSLETQHADDTAAEQTADPCQQIGSEVAPMDTARKPFAKRALEQVDIKNIRDHFRDHISMGFVGTPFAEISNPAPDESKLKRDQDFLQKLKGDWEIYSYSKEGTMLGHVKIMCPITKIGEIRLKSNGDKIERLRLEVSGDSISAIRPNILPGEADNKTFTIVEWEANGDELKSVTLKNSKDSQVCWHRPGQGPERKPSSLLKTRPVVKPKARPPLAPLESVTNFLPSASSSESQLPDAKRRKKLAEHNSDEAIITGGPLAKSKVTRSANKENKENKENNSKNTLAMQAFSRPQGVAKKASGKRIPRKAKRVPDTPLRGSDDEILES